MLIAPKMVYAFLTTGLAGIGVRARCRGVAPVGLRWKELQMHWGRNRRVEDDAKRDEDWPGGFSWASAYLAHLSEFLRSSFGGARGIDESRPGLVFARWPLRFSSPPCPSGSWTPSKAQSG